MLNNNKQTLFAIPEFNNNGLEIIQSIREKYDPKGFKTLQPHFTLVFSHIFDKNKFKQFMRHALNEIKLIPFTLNLALLVPPQAEHKSWYTFLVPEKGFSAITKVVYHLAKIDKKYILFPEPYIPHITVGSFETKEHCEKLTHDLNKNAIHITGQIKKFILTEAKNNNLEIHDEIYLENLKK